MMRLTLKGVVFFAVCMAGFVAHAQTMYRCGKVYQDRPCEKEAGKVVGSAGKEVADSQPSVDYECAKRGERSIKISWAREAGKTLDDQMGSEKNASERKLIADVYQKRGSSKEVRERIETECMAEKEKAAMNAAVANALVKSGSAELTPTSAGQPAGVAETGEGKANTADSASRIAAKKKSTCDSYSARLQSVQSRQKNGGSISYMESLNRQRQDIETLQRSAGC